MRVIICGGREYMMDALDWRRLDALRGGERAELGYLAPRLGPIAAVYHGDAPGADRWGALWAATRGVPVIPFPADWSRGKAGGPIRNGQMLRGEHPRLGQGEPADLVVAFDGGVGTADMVAQARGAGVPVLDFRASRVLRWTAEHVRDHAELVRHVRETGGIEAVLNGRAMELAREAHGGLAIPVVAAHLFKQRAELPLPYGSVYVGRKTMLRNASLGMSLPPGGDGSGRRDREAEQIP